MSLWRPSGMPEHNYDFYQWSADKQGLYESNYIKANSPDGKRALWLKHNILAPTQPNKPSLVELWCVYFSRGEAPRVVKQDIPAQSVRLATESLKMEGQDILLTPTRTATTIRDGKHTVSWDISIRPDDAVSTQPLIHFPYARMYTLPFPKKKLVTPQPKTRWDGVFRWDGEEIPIADWIGFRNHNWGTEHAWRYAYGNCNDFPEMSGLVVDAFSAKIRLGPFKSPFLSAGIVRQGREDLAFNAIRSIVGAKAHVEFPRWELRIERDEMTMEWLQEGRPAEFAGLPYLHPNGAKSYCYNTKWAKTTLRLRRGKTGWQEYRSEQGELEFLYNKPIHGIPLYQGGGSHR